MNASIILAAPKYMRAATALFATISGLLLLSPASSAAGENVSRNNPKIEESDSDDREILGTWIVEPFSDAWTFSEGGGLVSNSGANPFVGVFSTGHGTWAKTGRHEYTLVLRTRIFDFAGNITSWLWSKAVITVNPRNQRLSMTGTAKLYDASGNIVLATFPTEAGGARLQIGDSLQK